MEGIGRECAVRSRDVGRCVPLEYFSVFVLLPVLDGGVVHRHVDAADADALGMGFESVGSLRVDGDVLPGGNVVRSGQRDAHIAVIFHAGKGGGDVQRGDAHAENLGFVLALVRRVDGDVLRTLDGAVRDIDVRCAPVHDARVADAHAAKGAHGDSRHPDVGALLAVLRRCLRLQSVDVDVLARDRGVVAHGHVGVVVRMDDGVRDVHRRGAGRRDAYIFRGNVTNIRRLHIDVVPRRQSGSVDFGMDAHFPGIGRIRFVCRRGKAYGRIPCFFKVALVRAVQAIELCAAVAKDALRPVHAGKMLLDLGIGGVAYARRIVVLVFGARKLGVGDSLVDGGDGHIDADADAACSGARHQAVKAARFFRRHVDIVGGRDRTSRHMGAGAAVDVVQRDGHADAAEAARAHAARGVRRQFVRGFHGDVRRFQIAVRHQSRRLARGVVDAHVRRQRSADAHSQVGRDEGVLPVVLILRQHGDGIFVLVGCGFRRFCQVAVFHFRRHDRGIVHDGHAGSRRHRNHAGGHTCRDILRVAVAKMLRLDFCRAVKGRIRVFQQGAGGAGVLVTHDAVARGDANFAARSRRREGQRRRAVLGCSVHGQVLRVHVAGRNLRRRRPAIGLPVRRHAERDAQGRSCSYGRRTGEGAEIRIVHGIHIYIGSISLGIESGILNFGRSSTGLPIFSFDGIDVHCTRKVEPHVGRSRHAAGRLLGDDGMGGGAVHHNTGLGFVVAAAAGA